MEECGFCGEEFESKEELHLHWGETHGSELNSHQQEKVKKAERAREERKEQKMRKRKKYGGYGLAAFMAIAVLALLGSQLIQGGGEQKASFELDRQPAIGNPNASVTVVEFGDYQCPYCARFEQTVFPRLKGDYIRTGKVKFYFINYAYLGEDSTEAAVASECVLEQDSQQFWDFHNAVYGNQGSEGSGWVTADRMVSIARESTEDLDYDRLRSCIEGRQTLEEVKRDRRIAQENQVTGTPTVFVNGEQVDSWQYPGLKAAIEKKLNG